MARVRYYKVAGIVKGRGVAKIVATKASPSMFQKSVRIAKRDNKNLIIKRISKDKTLSLLQNAKKNYRLKRYNKSVVSKRIF